MARFKTLLTLEATKIIDPAPENKENDDDTQPNRDTPSTARKRKGGGDEGSKPKKQRVTPPKPPQKHVRERSPTPEGETKEDQRKRY